MEAKETRDALVEKVARELRVQLMQDNRHFDEVVVGGDDPLVLYCPDSNCAIDVEQLARAVIPIIERDLLREFVTEFARSRGYDLDQGETDGSV